MFEFIKAAAAKYASHKLALPIMALYGLIGNVVEVVPVSWVLSVFVALNPKQWKLFVISGVLGATIGVMVLTWMFHRWGLSWIIDRYPNLVNSSGWQSAELWVAQYGVLTLAVLAASPIALTPALAACGLMKMPILWAGGAVFIGKIGKYGVVAMVAKRAALASHNYSKKRKFI